MKNLSFNEKEMYEGPKKREQAHKHALGLERSNFQLKTTSFMKKETSDGRRHKHTNVPVTLKTELLSQKPTPQDGDRIRGL